MSLRAKWEFEYTAAALADAAAAQLAFRESRVLFWDNAQKEVIEKIKASGIAVHEDITSILSNSNKYGNTYAMGGAQIVIDPTMQTDLNKCYAKLEQHRSAAAQYKAWEQVLRAQHADVRVKLDHDDWMFFFGK